jgi:hypothetical protein
MDANHYAKGIMIVNLDVRGIRLEQGVVCSGLHAGTCAWYYIAFVCRTIAILGA